MNILLTFGLCASERYVRVRTQKVQRRHSADDRYGSKRISGQKGENIERGVEKIDTEYIELKLDPTSASRSA